MRNPGRPSQQLSMVPPVPIDCRSRPPAPEALSDDERVLWEKLVLARRPQWYLGAEALLQTYVTTVIATQRIEAALRKTRPGASMRYVTLAKLHRDNARLCASLATKLKLTPSTKIDRNISRDGDVPLAVAGLGYPVQPPREPDEIAAPNEKGERSFERLRARMRREGSRAQTVPPSSAEDEEPPSSQPPAADSENGSA